MRLAILILVASLLFACSSGKRKEPDFSPEKLKEPLIEHNKVQSKMEDDLIDKYVQRHQWEMKKTGTGLRYMIYEEGYGVKAEQGMVAVIKYELSLLDGSVVSKSKGDDTESFLIGKDDVESGLHEGITYMKVGDKAKLVVPSHLAHGLVGDQRKIPPRATIVYDLELVALN